MALMALFALLIAALAGLAAGRWRTLLPVVPAVRCARCSRGPLPGRSRPLPRSAWGRASACIAWWRMTCRRGRSRRDRYGSALRAPCGAPRPPAVSHRPDRGPGPRTPRVPGGAPRADSFSRMSSRSSRASRRRSSAAVSASSRSSSAVDSASSCSSSAVDSASLRRSSTSSSPQAAKVRAMAAATIAAAKRFLSASMPRSVVRATRSEGAHAVRSGGR